MKIEVRTLVDENEMLSHIFLGCIPTDKLMQIRDKFIYERDWTIESVKIPVELKIGGVAVNPKQFFDNWKEQMQDLINERAETLLKEKIGSGKTEELRNRLYEIGEVLDSFSNEVNWDAKNPFL